MASKDYARTLTSFSGSDLVVNFGPKTIGELQQISWGVKREKAPVFTLGSPDARSFSRGKRGIGGSLIMAQFNRDALMEELVDDDKMWGQIAPVAMFTAAGNLAKRGSEKFAIALSTTGWNKVGNITQSNMASGGNFDAAGNYIGGGNGFGMANSTTVEDVSPATAIGNDGVTPINMPTGFGLIKQANILYADMIPPFDVTLTFANEYGQAAFQKIYDIDILDEQSGVSVDSIVMERAMSYVARRISPLMTGVYSRSSGEIQAKPVY